MGKAIANSCVLMVIFLIVQPSLLSQHANRSFEDVRQAAIEEARAKWRKEAETPEFIERQREIDKIPLPVVNLKELEQIRKTATTIRARALSVSENSILAAIRVRKQLPNSKRAKAPRFTVSSELDDPYFIVGLDTSDIVDNDSVDLTVYSAGKHSYVAVSGAWKTVRRVATSPELAASLIQEKR